MRVNKRVKFILGETSYRVGFRFFAIRLAVETSTGHAFSFFCESVTGKHYLLVTLFGFSRLRNQ